MAISKMVIPVPGTFSQNIFDSVNISYCGIISGDAHSMSQPFAQKSDAYFIANSIMSRGRL